MVVVVVVILPVIVVVVVVVVVVEQCIYLYMLLLGRLSVTHFIFHSKNIIVSIMLINALNNHDPAEGVVAVRRLARLGASFQNVTFSIVSTPAGHKKHIFQCI